MSIETLRPNAAGDEENIDNVVGDGVGTHYTVVDEATPDGYTTTVHSSNSTYLRDFYNIEDHSVGSGIISKITVKAVCIGIPENGLVSSLKIAIKSGTGTGAPDTPAESSEITLNTIAWTEESNDWNTNPATGSPWTWDEIDKLQIGVAIKECGYGGGSYCTQVYVEVGYTPAAAAFASPAGKLIAAGII